MISENVKVVKFGGSSLADAGQFRKVIEIIRADESRRYVIPSAPGKRFPGDDKITDLLYRCYEAATSKSGEFDAIYAKITDRYRTIIRELDLDFSLEDDFSSIQYAIQHKAGRDFAASRGEYLNAKILAQALGYYFLDAAEVIFFREDGSFDAERTNKVLKQRLSGIECAVIPGFYGSMPNDTIRTFSRGGSDITGSITARAVDADLYENWTDVSGCLMADPRVVDHPRVIETITYTELRELSYMGATVLHEDAIFPVRFAGIPINIRNTNDPAAPGTMIVSSAPSDPAHCGLITGIAGKKGFSVLTVEKDMMNAEVGFGRRVLEAIENEGISFEHLPSGIDTMSVVINDHDLAHSREAIVNRICSVCNPETITIDQGIALLAVVGRGMKNSKGTAARVVRAIADADISIRIIDQGSSELNIIIGVMETDFERAMRAIYAEFVS